MDEKEAIECCVENYRAIYGVSPFDPDAPWRPDEWIIQAAINAYFYGRQG